MRRVDGDALVVDAPRQSLEHLPVTGFAAVMGLGGTALAWRRAGKVWDLPQWGFAVFEVFAVGVFLTVAAAYLVKAVRYPAATRAEFGHPVRMAFVPTITISMLILATGLQDWAPAVASVLWWVGAVGHLLATVWVLTMWSTRPDIGANHVTPAWFIPVVGNIVTPLAAPAVGSVELGWFAFGVGVVFWLGLLPLLLQRLLTHEQPFPVNLLPMYAIFAAPPAVALLSWQSLTGDLSAPLPRVLYAATIMFTVLVAAQIGRLRRVPFGMPYWAYTFPAAAAATAAIAADGAWDGAAYLVAASLMLTLATALSLGVLLASLSRLAQGRLLLPERVTPGPDTPTPATVR